MLSRYGLKFLCKSSFIYFLWLPDKSDSNLLFRLWCGEMFDHVIVGYPGRLILVIAVLLDAKGFPWLDGELERLLLSLVLSLDNGGLGRCVARKLVPVQEAIVNFTGQL